MPAGLDPWALVGQSVDTSGLTPDEMAQFNWLTIYNGVPPDVARSMATTPQYSEGQPTGRGWPTPYAGQELERSFMGGPQRDEPLNKQVPPNLQKPRYKQDISYQADYGDPTASAPAYPTLDDRYQALIAQGIPAVVARSMVYQPSYAEGQNPYSGWPFPYAGQDVEAHSRRPPPASEAIVRPGIRIERQDIGYQPGGNQMPGMPWDPSAGAGMGAGLTSDMLNRIQAYYAIMGMGRGAGGMQLNPNTNNLVNQLQGGGQQGGMGLSPQIMALLNYWRQTQGQGAPGTYPSGGGVNMLAQLLGAPQQGQPT